MISVRRFRCEPEAVTAARRFVRDVLSNQPVEVKDAAELMASELTANCVRHAGTDFELEIHAHGDIRIEVHDSGAGTPRLLSPSPEEPTGRGLRIVDRMSDAWGVRQIHDGKAVWFTISRSP